MAESLHPIELALSQLDSEIQALGSPMEGTYQWFILRAKVLSRSCLLRMRQLSAHMDPRLAEEFYRSCGKAMKTGAGV